MKKSTCLVFLAGSTFLLLLSGCTKGGQKLNTNTAPGVNEVLEARIAEEEQKAADNSESETSEEEFTPTLPEYEPRQSGLNENAPEPEEADSEVVLSTTEGIDVDLTILSSTMVYSQVYDMISRPEDYEGKIIRMQGTVGSYQDDLTGNKYYGCIIRDATQCCAQGIEFVLADGQNYPADEEDITLTGEFGTYMEDGFLYCTLKEAKLEE